ncbi:MAG: Bax protein [Gammaproteobacteria bacterium]|jgi:Bax protein
MNRRSIGKFLESLTVRGIELIYNFFESDFFADNLSLIQEVLTGIFGALFQLSKQVLQSKVLRQLCKRIYTHLKKIWQWVIKSISEIDKRLKTHSLVPYYRDKFAQLYSSIKRNPRFFGPVTLILLMIFFWPDPGSKFEPEKIQEVESVVTTKSEPALPEKEFTQPVPDTFQVLPNFNAFAAGPERKNAFFDYFLPLIANANQSVLESRERINHWYQNRQNLTVEEKRRIQNIANYYRVRDFNLETNDHWEILFTRVNQIPPSLALAQAANESAWGTSRFARKGNNFYGQWCFEPGCGLVPAKRDPNKTHEVAAFESPKESVNRYIHNLNSHRAYRNLRKIRQQLEKHKKTITGYELAAGLDKYSERGQDYIKELRAMIRFNKLEAYDKVIGQGK